MPGILVNHSTCVTAFVLLTSTNCTGTYIILYMILYVTGLENQKHCADLELLCMLNIVYLYYRYYRLVTTDEENKQLKIEMSELRARHKVDLERVRQSKEREMEEVHGRVKQALAKKEENLMSLRQQYEAALKRADHLEMLLERQRKELLKK